ncbi:hypothetical protein IV203_010087 [Nitzschia inconspicua]|uniref:Uncharacterized protein n=1 Tax=Nitzschia inconspicua TaxID=303405 RepID=A0A9K3PK61_9STRA|nr:hypothetical protein IV203_010087 [Nitzschia inconspicua]
MLSQASRRTLQSLSRNNRVVVAANRRSMMAFADKAKLREKVEEDRYMKEQEEAWKEKLRALKQQEETSRDAAHHAEVVDPVKKDIEKLLAETGDKVSDAGLENLAKFRLDL